MEPTTSIEKLIAAMDNFERARSLAYLNVEGHEKKMEEATRGLQEELNNIIDERIASYNPMAKTGTIK